MFKSIQYAKKILGVGSHHRADDGLPFNARIGSVVQFQLAPFIRHTVHGGLSEQPAESMSSIVAISRFRIDIAGSVFRFYLNTGDVDANETFIQVYVNEAGMPLEAVYCQTLTRLIPETLEDQIAFTGDEGYGLGEQVYSLSKEQLIDVGVPEQIVSSAVGPDDLVAYTRSIDPNNEGFIKPFQGYEERIDDAAGKNGLKQKIYYMPYFRNVAGDEEQLLITTEVIESINHAEKPEIHVDFMVGVPLELERLTIQ